jgi:hypothetical protein
MVFNATFNNISGMRMLSREVANTNFKDFVASTPV